MSEVVINQEVFTTQNSTDLSDIWQWQTVSCHCPWNINAIKIGWRQIALVWRLRLAYPGELPIIARAVNIGEARVWITVERVLEGTEALWHSELLQTFDCGIILGDLFAHL